MSGQDDREARRERVAVLLDCLGGLGVDVLPVVEAALTIHLGMSVQIRTMSPGQWH